MRRKIKEGARWSPGPPPLPGTQQTPQPIPYTLRTRWRPTVDRDCPASSNRWICASEGASPQSAQDLEAPPAPEGGSLSPPRSPQPAAAGRSHIHMVISACELPRSRGPLQLPGGRGGPGGGRKPDRPAAAFPGPRQWALPSALPGAMLRVDPAGAQTCTRVSLCWMHLCGGLKRQATRIRSAA